MLNFCCVLDSFITHTHTHVHTHTYLFKPVINNHTRKILLFSLYKWRNQSSGGGKSSSPKSHSNNKENSFQNFSQSEIINRGKYLILVVYLFSSAKKQMLRHDWTCNKFVVVGHLWRTKWDGAREGRGASRPCCRSVTCKRREGRKIWVRRASKCSSIPRKFCPGWWGILWPVAQWRSSISHKKGLMVPSCATLDWSSP